MNPYLLTSIIFGAILCVVYVFVSLPRTIYLPSVEGVQETVETKKKKAQAIRSRTFILGVGGTIGACLLTMFVIWASGPVKIVYAAFNPSATPTITNTPTSTPTRTSTPTPRSSPTSRLIGSLEAMTTLTGQGPTGTARPGLLAPSSGGGGGSITIIQTRVVIQVQTRIVYVTQFVVMTVPVTVIVTVTHTPLITATVDNTATLTPTLTVTATVAASSTPTPTVTPSATQTETPTP
jgi:hypothetical protein